MKKKFVAIFFGLVLLLCISLGFIFLNQVDFSNKSIIKVNDWQVINESGCGNSLHLVDEFNASGFTPQSFWRPSEHKVCNGEKYSLIVNFEAKVECQSVYIFSKGFGELVIGQGADQSKANSHTLIYGWNKINVNFSDSFLFLRVLSELDLGALVVEGKYLANPKERIHLVNYPTFNEFIGINALVDDPLGAMDVANHVREYHETVWHQLGETNFNFSPSFSGFEFEPFYKNFGVLGYSITPVVQHSGKWVTGSDNGEAIPCPSNLSTTDPMSYKGHATLLYEILKNFKSKQTPLRYIENWNEPDKSWHGKEAYISPYEYASFSSMDYDGHLNRNLTSIKNGDSTTTLVMAGLTDLRSDYINALKYWCDRNRNGDFPWGVVNVHVYANDPAVKSGITPERFKLQQKVAAFVKSSKLSAPRAQVWLSEFGYDRKDDSPQHVPTIEGYTADEVQAILLLRSFLLLSTTGLDKAYQYMLRDTKGKGTYASSGLYKTENNRNIYLPSWHYLKTLHDVLGNYKFSRRIDTPNKDLYVLEYQNKGKVGYAIWFGLDIKASIDEKLPLKFKMGQRLTSYEFSNTGKSTKTSLIFNDTKFNITDRPIIILDTLIEEKVSKKLDIADLQITESNKTLLDEISGFDPLYQPAGSPITLHELKTTNISLRTPKFISYLSLFDDQGQSDIVIEAVYNGTSKLIFDGRTSLYKKWKSLRVNTMVDSILISHKTNTSKIGEIVLYGY